MEVISKFKSIGAVIIGIFILFLLFWLFCIKSIPPTNIGVKTTFGKIDTENTLNEGIHVISPFTSVTLVKTSVQTAVSEKSEAASKDLQTVTSDITVNYHIDPGNVIAVYKRNPNLNYNRQFVIPAINETLKATIAQYTVTDIIAKRAELSEKFTSELKKKLDTYYLTVNDVNIVNLDFSDVFNTAIEQKMKASQEAEKAKFELEKADLEAKQIVTKAKGEAEAIRIKTEAIRQSGGKEYVALEAINKWNGEMPVYYGTNAPLPMINVK